VTRLPFTVNGRTHWLALADRASAELRLFGSVTVTVPLLTRTGRIHRYARVAVTCAPHAVAAFIAFTPSPNR